MMGDGLANFAIEEGLPLGLDCDGYEDEGGCGGKIVWGSHWSARNMASHWKHREAQTFRTDILDD